MKYYVGFFASSERCWWDVLNKRGFEHCAAFRPEYGGRCVGVEFNKTGLHPESIFVPAEVALREMLERSDCTCVIEVEINEAEREWYAGRGMLNCVSATKAFLGMGSFWTDLTPHRLARRLLAMGGVLHLAKHIKGLE